MRDKPYYSLAQVRQLAQQEGGCLINEKARRTALADFGWGIDEIKRAVSLLKVSDFYKSEFKYDNPKITAHIYVDTYKAKNLLGERVYTHFRIEDGKLVICSFKEI